MKVQMKFQKIICIVALVTSALFFLIGIGLTTDLYNLYLSEVEGFNVYWDVQPFNSSLVKLAIMLIILAALLFFTMTHNRRRYYISNYIMIGVVVIAFIGVSAYSLINLFTFRAQYLSELKEFGADYKAMTEINKAVKYTESTFWFDINIVIAAITIIVALLLLSNLIWKITLMKKEDELLSMSHIDVEKTTPETNL